MPYPLIIFFSLLVIAFPAAAYRVQIPRDDLLLNAEYHPSAQEDMPAILIMHGCGGLYAKPGEIGARMSRMGGLLREMGYGVLYVDSFTPRGIRQVCISKSAAQEVTPAMRADDAEAAIRWLRRQSKVDGDRIGVLGWSHGADAVLELLGRKNRSIRAAVTFYPACRLITNKKSRYRVSAPTLVLVGESDEWTPVQDCKVLAARTGQDLFHVVSYPDALHDFDAPVLNAYVKYDVPNYAGSSNPALIGADPEAMHDANRRTFKWFARWFDPERAIAGPPPSSKDSR